jgi:hypothetical protein
VQDSIKSALRIAINDNPMSVGLVFHMTDCLSADDDEEPHPVYLPDFIVYLCTRGAERKRFYSNPGKSDFFPWDYPLPRTTPRDSGTRNPVFPNRSSYGLIG